MAESWTKQNYKGRRRWWNKTQMKKIPCFWGESNKYGETLIQPIHYNQSLTLVLLRILWQNTLTHTHCLTDNHNSLSTIPSNVLIKEGGLVLLLILRILLLSCDSTLTPRVFLGLWTTISCHYSSFVSPSFTSSLFFYLCFSYNHLVVNINIIR